MENLATFQKDVYSQFGEDGILREILTRLRRRTTLNSWCVEFGAWDGVFLSNTCRLIREEKFSAVLIEGEKARVDELNKNFPEENVYKICSFINFEGENSLDNTLARTPLPRDFDVLSIDVDGVDFHIFESMEKYSPKVVCIEFNPAIPNAVDFVQARDFTIKQGTSARAIVRLAKEKGYSLVAATTCNLIFVLNHLRKFVLEYEPTLETLNPGGNDPTYVFSGLDGTILSNKEGLGLLWHAQFIPFAKLQALPEPLRIFSGDYRRIHKVLFVLWLISKRHPPHEILRISRKMGFIR